MPTETFYRLPDGKRRKLVAAIYGEIARVPFAEASINRIIKAADIARGSYYQYFRDKDDLYNFVLSDFRALLQENAERTLEEHGGDLFSAMLAGFDAAAAYASEPENLAFCKNLFSHMRLSDPSMFAPNPGEACGALLPGMRARVNTGLLRFSGDGELRLLFEILGTQFRAAIAELVSDVSRAPELRRRFEQKLALLQRGLALEEKGESAYAG